MTTNSQTQRVVLLGKIEEQLRQRANGIDGWLDEIGSACKTEQRHCEEGTAERVYWHYGYMVAVKDVLDLLESAALPVN